MKYVSMLILSGLVFTACHSKKKLVFGGPKKLDSFVFMQNQNGKDSLLRQKWEYFSGRMDMDYYSQEEDQAFTISLRMRKDSIIWFSLSLNAGVQIQVMKGIITKDSIKALDLHNKKYYHYGISALGKRFGADLGLHELQNIFIGNPIYDTLVYQKDAGSKAWLAVNPPVTNLIYSADFQRVDSTLLAQKGTQRQLKGIYTGSMQAGALNIAQFIDLFAYSASNSVRLQIEFKTATDAVIPSYPFTVPSGYEQVNEE